MMHFSKTFTSVLVAALLASAGPGSADLPAAASGPIVPGLGQFAPQPRALALRCEVIDNPQVAANDVAVLPTVAPVSAGTPLRWQASALEGTTTLPALELGQWHIVASVLPQVVAVGTPCRALLG